MILASPKLDENPEYLSKQKSQFANTPDHQLPESFESSP
jgi:hypothetical protein